MIQTVRLVKFLSSSGVASRRAAGELVKSGRVRVNDETVTEPGLQIHPESDRVCFDGNPVRPESEQHYIMLNKPRGYVCTNQDIHAEKKAIDLICLPGVRLFSAGRLDKDSEGMLLFSNDGDYVNTLLHPRNQILKTYHVELAAELSEPQLAAIRSGIRDEGETLHVQSIQAIGLRRYEIRLNEGKKREIRRITAAVGAPTLRLKRVRTGALELGNLPSGKWKELSRAEIDASLLSSPGDGRK